MENTELAQLGLLPISPEAPCGKSAREEPEYDQLAMEMNKLQALTPEPVDWPEVIRLGSLLLKEKSKDLLVASYLTVGLFEKQGYRGLATGLTIYRDLIKEYWESLFPEKKRLRGRINAIEWMAERLGKEIAKTAPEASDQENVKQCFALVDQLSQLLDEKLGEQSPNLSMLLRPLREFRLQIEQQEKQQTHKPEPQPEPKPAPPPPAQPKPVTSAPPSAAAPPAEVATESDMQKAFRTCQTLLGNIATFLRNKNLADALSYRIVRLSTWLMIRQLPPSQNQMTQITKVPEEIIQKYESLLSAQDYKVLIPEVEVRFSRDPFWLDAHRFTATALEALGTTYAEARKTVVEELASFLQRMPGLLDLKFSDGTPFADDQTRLWIESEVLQPQRGETVQEVVTIPSGREQDGTVDQRPWIQVTQEAKRLAGKGQFSEGITLFQEGQKQSSSERERFLWRLYQARFCFEAGYLDVAIPQLEFLDAQVERFGLEVWEPALSLDVAQLLLLCYYKWLEKIQKPEERILEKTRQLHARLCRLDVLAALATQPGKR